MALLEIACFNTESALNAQNACADRIELCDGISIGGITPDFNSLFSLRSTIAIPVFVMIRPRGGNFVYSDAEYGQMKSDITRFKAIANGFVFGMLDTQNCIDVARNSELVALARPLPCTFHRAFDETRNIYDALEDVIRCDFASILTSGGQPNAVLGVEVLSDLIERARGRVVIMPGGGVRSSNVKTLQCKTKAGSYHSSAIIDGNTASVAEIHLLRKLLQQV